MANDVCNGRRLMMMVVIYWQLCERMSRNNVFKLSGNMALGGGKDYPSNDFDNIKNSLKLLKSKQGGKRNEAPLEPTNYYGGSYSSNSQSRPSQQAKNLAHYDQPSALPSRNSQQQYSYKDMGYEQPSYNNPYPSKQPKQPPSYEMPPERNPPRRQPPQQKPAPQRAPPRRQEIDNYGGGKAEEKSIKQMNMENRMEIKEYDPSQFVECRAGCGRKFNPESIAKHEANCRKVFQKKRKEFNTQQQRLVDNQQKQLMRQGETVDRKMEAQKAKQKLPKWKAQSLELRTGIKQARNDDYAPSAKEQQMLQAAQQDQMVKCHTCGRTFNENAAKRHIPFCEQQQKKKQFAPSKKR